MTIFCDVHGVLVESAKMIQNYESTLIKMFEKYGKPREEAINHHNAGLHLFLNQIKSIKSKNLTGSEFLQAMDKADKEWDNLMQSFVATEEAHDLESRNVEFLAGNNSDSFYKDGKVFIQQLLTDPFIKDNGEFFIVSNSHSKHILGLFNGAGFKNFDSNKLLGWDKTESLKNLDYYYSKLLSFSHSKLNIIIGNSQDEMVLGKKAGFKTVFIEREIKEPINFESFIDLKVPNLLNLSHLLKEKVI